MAFTSEPSGLFGKHGSFFEAAVPCAHVLDLAALEERILHCQPRILSATICRQHHAGHKPAKSTHPYMRRVVSHSLLHFKNCASMQTCVSNVMCACRWAQAEEGTLKAAHPVPSAAPGSSPNPSSPCFNPHSNCADTSKPWYHPRRQSCRGPCSRACSFIAGATRWSKGGSQR